jgi:tripartite-type tricarboxylate transporter receptor subunit TctC
MKIPHTVWAVAAASAPFATHVQATAQAFPTRQVTMIVPFAPGGLSDGIGRIVATKLAEKWKTIAALGAELP